MIIRYENGKSEVWGYEPDVKIAEEVARDIEIGLKAIDYVSFELMKLLSEIGEQLQTLGIPPAMSMTTSPRTIIRYQNGSTSWRSRRCRNNIRIV